MFPDRNRTALLAVLLAATVLLSGCSAAIGPLGNDAQQSVADTVQHRIERIDGFSAVEESTITVGNETRTSRVRLWVDLAHGRVRSETLAPERRAGDVMVVNDTAVLSYDASENTATRMNNSGLGTGASQLGSQLDTLFERYDVSYQGTERLDGQQTYRLRLTSANESRLATNLTMWVGTDSQFPLKIRYETSGVLNSTATIRFRNVSINPGLSADRFTIDLPDGASVRTPSFDVNTYDSRAALANATSGPVPHPEVPDGFEFQTGTRVGNDTVVEQYTNGTAPLLVRRTAGEEDVGTRGGESITVNGHEGRYRSAGRAGTVTWHCNGATYAVSGGLSRSALRSVAASLDCS